MGVEKTNIQSIYLDSKRFGDGNEKRNRLYSVDKVCQQFFSLSCSPSPISLEILPLRAKLLKRKIENQRSEAKALH